MKKQAAHMVTGVFYILEGLLLILSFGMLSSQVILIWINFAEKKGWFRA